MKIHSETVKAQFPDWADLKPGSWSKHPINLCYGTAPYESVEIGLYREPLENEEYAGTYTLQIMHGDDVILCQTVH